MEVKFLEHEVSCGGIAIDPSKVEAVMSWERPTTVTEIRSFLGLVGYYRKFIKGFSQLALPLTKLTRKNTPFDLTLECERSFQELKYRLTTIPVLVLPDPKGSFKVMENFKILHSLNLWGIYLFTLNYIAIKEENSNYVKIILGVHGKKEKKRKEKKERKDHATP